jgi:hypothetical protein
MMRKSRFLAGTALIMVIAIVALQVQSSSPESTPEFSTPGNAPQEPLDRDLDPYVQVTLGRAAVVDSGRPLTASDEPVSDRLGHCFSGETVDRACVRALCSRMSAVQLGEWLCDTSLGLKECSVVMQEYFCSVAPASLMEIVDLVQSECERFRETPILLSAFKYACAESADWCGEVERFLTAETLFGARSEGPVQLSEALAMESEYVMMILEDGGRGYHGGSAAQMHRAALIAVVLSPNEERYLSYLESLIDSPLTTADGGIGCLLAHFGPSGRGAISGNYSRVVSLLRRMLIDPRFRVDAANQLTRDRSPIPPDAFPLAEWSEIMATATAIVEAN